MSKEDLKLQANLNVLRRKDPRITSIVDSTPHVVQYEFADGSWRKRNIEGTMFLFRRSTRPHFGLFIMNRMSTSNYLLPLTKALAFKVNGDYLMYQTDTGDITGIWFFEGKDRDRFFEQVTEMCQMDADDKDPGPDPSTAPASPSTTALTPPPALASDLTAMLHRARDTAPHAAQAASDTGGSGDDLARLFSKLRAGPSSLPSAGNGSAPASTSAPREMRTLAEIEAAIVHQQQQKVAAAAAASAAANAAPAPAPAVDATSLPLDTKIQLAAAANPSLLAAALPRPLPRDGFRDAMVALLHRDAAFLDALYAGYLQAVAHPPPPTVPPQFAPFGPPRPAGAPPMAMPAMRAMMMPPIARGFAVPPPGVYASPIGMPGVVGGMPPFANAPPGTPPSAPSS
ncbi:mRNA-decapping enzyme 1A [Allomyces javanicus]|nr:mRNA-decapping enzyme 1A [Allomyces javanicus]